MFDFILPKTKLLLHFSFQKGFSTAKQLPSVDKL